MQVDLPKDSPAIDVFAGEVLDSENGDVLSTFQINAKSLDAGQRTLYHLTFPLAAGSYRYRFGGFSGSTVQFVHAGDIEIPETPEGTWLSPIWVGLDTRQENDAMLGQAYTFGVWHLMPLCFTKTPKSAQLSYFGYVIHPEVEEGKTPTAHLKLTLRKDGKRLGRPANLNLPMVKVTENVYMYANSIQLKALPDGPCTLEFKLTEPGVEKPSERSVELDIVP